MNKLQKFIVNTLGLKDSIGIGSGVVPLVINGEVFYPGDTSYTYIEQGYNMNPDVFAIVSLAAAKFAQVPWFVYKVKAGKQKEAAHYRLATKGNRNKSNYRELQAMKRKALDETVVDNDLSALLQQPNRHQGQDSFLEQLYGFKLLTGEGNIWFNRGLNPNGPVLEMLLIPKPNLLLRVKENDPWGINGYEMLFGATRIPVDTGNMIMWKFPTYEFDPFNKTHLRGQAPLRSMIPTLHASNAAARREAALFQNAGVNGILVDETVRPIALSQDQLDQVRQQVHSRVNGTTKAGNVTTMSGKWSYLQLGMTASDLGLMDAKKLTTKALCSGFGVPIELFDPSVVHANKSQAKKNWVYDTIAPACYSLRDELNRQLLQPFGLNRDEYFIDCDVLSLPDMSDEMSDQVAAIKDVWQLTPNQVLDYLGWDKSGDPNMDKHYIPSSYVLLDDLGVGGNLIAEQNLINGGL